MDPDPSIFIIDLQDANKKLILKKFLKVLLHHFSKVKSQKSHRTVEIKVFLNFLLNYRRIRIRIRIPYL
jgi:hypothetical protein